jgi:hypothetical protein
LSSILKDKTDPSEKFLNEEHSFPLVPGLTPVVNIENVHSILLGAPYTDCNPEKGYTVTGCRYKNLLEQIIKICQCFPAYMKDGIDLIPKKYNDCVFSMHASCVSFVMTKFGESEVYCKPACTAKTMRQESIHYSKLGEKNVEFLQQSRKTPNQLGWCFYFLIFLISRVNSFIYLLRFEI